MAFSSWRIVRVEANHNLRKVDAVVGGYVDCVGAHLNQGERPLAHRGEWAQVKE